MYIRAPSARDPSITASRYIRQPGASLVQAAFTGTSCISNALFVGADEIYNKYISVKYLFQLMSMVCALSIVGLQTVERLLYGRVKTKTRDVK